jgi:hypothetical protein
MWTACASKSYTLENYGLSAPEVQRTLCMLLSFFSSENSWVHCRCSKHLAVVLCCFLSLLS